MAMYKNLNGYSEDKARHISDRLLSLREKLKVEITDNRRANSLIIGSWNIRNFDNGMGGEREDEAYHYLAEIIDRFDICAIQEVMGDLEPLRRLVKLLGPQWDYFVTDITSGSAGNQERSAFVYNKNKVFFRNLVGEIVLPTKDLIDGRQFARTPFFAAFQAHWFRFILCSTHIVYGKATKAGEIERAKEIEALATNVAKRAKKDGEVYILLGDFNVIGPGNPTMEALKKGKLMIPDFGGTNLKKNKFYDQITFTGEGQKVKLLRKGTFDWQDCVFLDSEKKHYKQYNVKLDKKTKKNVPRYKDWDKSYKMWTTHQVSDHLPIWVELEIDYSDDYLERFSTPDA